MCVPVIDELMNETFLSPVVTEENSSCLITVAAMSENWTSGGLSNFSLKLSNQLDLTKILNGASGTCINYVFPSSDKNGEGFQAENNDVVRKMIDFLIHRWYLIIQ